MLSYQVQSNDENIRWSEPLILLLTPNMQNVAAAFHQNTLQFKQKKAKFCFYNSVNILTETLHITLKHNIQLLA